MMDSNEARCADHRRFMLIDAAFRNGDLAALRAAVDDPAAIPNGPMLMAIVHCLEYAIYHSPLPFIRTLLEIGADPNRLRYTSFTQPMCYLFSPQAERRVYKQIQATN